MYEETPHIALTPRMRRTIQNAARIAEERGHDWLGTEHVLLALLDDPAGIAGSGIRLLGYEPALRQMVEGVFASAGYGSSSSERP